MKKDLFFNAHHAPIGAFASFTLGCKGANGGLGLELGRPANESVYVGLQSADGTRYDALPFFAGAEDDAKRYTVSHAKAATGGAVPLTPFADRAIARAFSATTDCWTAGDLTFTIHTPLLPVPEPRAHADADLTLALLPAIFAELTVDNRRGKRARRAFFGYSGSSPDTKLRRLDDTSDGQYTGIGMGGRTAIACADAGVRSATSFGFDTIMGEKHAENLAFALGDTGLLLADVPAGTRRTFHFTIAFYREGTVTTGLPTHYLYTRWFPRIEEVITCALTRRTEVFKRTQAQVRRLKLDRLPEARRFQLAHAIRSYYGSTEALTTAKGPFWVVNEGEYRMMNTFDLTADQVFFELMLNPWTVRNELTWFADRYCYTDKVRFPGDPQDYPGGISFTHDMGVVNNLSRPGHSAYEKAGLDGCFSHMTHEELTNWVLCGAAYVAHTGDRRWLLKTRAVFESCFESLCNRDHPIAAQRTGVMALDSSRCQGGAEITTYDSLDTSLGQARGNLYLAVKDWAAYACLAELFDQIGRKQPAAAMRAQARRAADTLVRHADADGLLPAILGEGVNSRIIPAIEGLAFPWFCGYRHLLAANGPYADLLGVLRAHLTGILRPGLCLFADGGWKLSSTSDNSWLSKIYLCQFVAREILGLPDDRQAARADAAHVAWLLRPENRYWAWSDQIVSGIAKGSKYYPRGVTAILWTLE